uniref:Uncharacterized protein n=1 Tax=Eutreptiella gymnastica TaxID=73025 RepID=A0A7S1J0K9_9EUGL|mmetsp:Transcript_58161/g.103783  ORF Transcript_58161/g.103783 Transcript_58161/m.103783 type:complete len:100 (+) Transcript_58161:67-366(+)
MQAARMAARSFRPMMRAQFLRNKGVQVLRNYSSAVSSEMVTRTPYTRPGWSQQWACLVILFLKNQLALRIGMIGAGYVLSVALFGVRMSIETDDDAAPN